MLIFVFSPESVFINMAMDFSKLTRIYSEPNVFRLTWVINNVCTQHCRYCPDMLHRGANQTSWTFEQAAAFSQKIFALDRPVELSIAGGEPTLSPWLKPLIKLYKQQGHTVTLTSNGSRSVDYWRDITVDYLCLSYHPSWARGDWLEKLSGLARFIPNITVRLMMDPDRWEQCMMVYETLLEGHPTVSIEPVRIVDWGAATVSYDPLQNQWLDQQTTVNRSPPNMDTAYADTETQQHQALPVADLERSGYNKFTGWQCNIGLDSLFIQFDGSIRRGNCEQDGYIGWIQDPDFQLPTTATTCRVYVCHCATDVKTPKQRQFKPSKTIPIYRLPRTSCK
jgi:hypothetical protein